ncbi:MAG: tetratricopeptide repeat protein [Geminicoccaceae bacterium]
MSFLISGCIRQDPGEAELRAAVEASLPSIESLEQRGQLELASRRPVQALETYAAILERDPEHIAARLGVAEAQLMLGNAERARAGFVAVEAWPGLNSADRALARQGIGLCDIALGDLGNAKKRLDAALAGNPSLWRSWVGIGRIHDRDRAWVEAEAAYNKAERIAPQEASIYNNHGLSRLGARDFDGAIRMFDAALDLDPALTIADRNRRIALAFQGRYETAVAGTEPSELAEVLNNVGYAAIVRQDYVAARAHLVRAIEISPSYFEPAWANLRYLDALQRRGGVVVPSAGGVPGSS